MRLFAAGRAGTLKHQVMDEDGNASDADATVTVEVTDDAGDVAQTGSAVDAGLGVYTFALNAAVRGALGRYTAIWTYDLDGAEVTETQQFEVVSEFLFDVADLRAFDMAFEDEERYPADAIKAARDTATENMEQSAMVAYAQRARRVTLSGDGTSVLLLPDVEILELHEVWVDGTEVDVADVEVRRTEGILVYSGGWAFGTDTVEVRYVHGYEVTPGPVRTAAMILARDVLVPSALPGRAMSQSTDLGEFRISLANPDAGRDTGIPDVDSVNIRFGRRRPVIK